MVKGYKENEKKETSDQAKNGRKQEVNAAPTATKSKVKRSYKEQREFELLEKEIEKLEFRKNELTISLQSTDLPFNDIQKLSRELTSVMQLIDEKSMRWLVLSEIA